MRRLALVAATLVVPVLPVLAAAPAFAVDNVICVPVMVAGCNQAAATIPLAITAANANVLDDLVKVAPGTYNDGPYQLAGGAHRLTLQGAGQGSDPATSTLFTLPTSASIQNYVLAGQATVQNLRIVMTGGANSNDTGLFLIPGGTADHVTIAGAGTVNSTGAHLDGGTLTASSVPMPPGNGPGTRAVYVEGDSIVSDSILTGGRGVVQSAGGKTDSLSRLTIQASDYGIVTDGGTVAVDDTVIDMGTAGNSTGIVAANFNGSTVVKTINATHMTILGGGAGSRGVWAYAADLDGKQTAVINLGSSIVRGPATSLVADARNDGAQGGPSNATLNVSYSDYQNVGGTIGLNGAGGVAVGAGNLINVDPAFVNAAAGDYHLAPASPLVDKGNPAPAGPATDRDGAPRVLDGDGVGGAVRDMGAYERPAAPVVVVADTVAPETAVTKKPGKRVTKKKVKLTFSSEAGATFQCQVDGKAWKVCTSPLKLKVKVRKHVVLVRALDAAGNIDATPAMVKFKRVATR